jgi:hypothetical protein
MEQTGSMMGVFVLTSFVAGPMYERMAPNIASQ